MNNGETGKKTSAGPGRGGEGGGGGGGGGGAEAGARGRRALNNRTLAADHYCHQDAPANRGLGLAQHPISSAGMR